MGRKPNELPPPRSLGDVQVVQPAHIPRTPVQLAWDGSNFAKRAAAMIIPGYGEEAIRAGAGRGWHLDCGEFLKRHPVREGDAPKMEK